jgi:hypothetical protein
VDCLPECGFNGLADSKQLAFASIEQLKALKRARWLHCG